MSRESFNIKAIHFTHFLHHSTGFAPNIEWRVLVQEILLPGKELKIQSTLC